MQASGELHGSCKEADEGQPLLGKAANKLQQKRTFTKKMLKLFVAAICITVMVSSWAVMAEKLQDLDSSYHKPFFQSYWIRCCYSVMYIFWKLWLVFPGHFSCNRVGEGTLTNFKKLAIFSGFLNIVAYSSGILWIVSLDHTSVSANTAIYQSSSALVFIISVPLLGERVTLVKIASVTFTVIGVCVVSLLRHYPSRSLEISHNGTYLTNVFSAHEQSQGTPLGYVYVLLSTVLYAVYETFYKRFGTREDDTAPVFNGIRVLGYVGVHSLLYNWILLVIVHFTGIERFELPTLQALYLLFAIALLDIIFNAALIICLTISSPLFASVGSVLTIPMSVLLDWILRSYILSWQSFIGVCIILIGFFGIATSEYWKIRRKSEVAKEPENETHLTKSIQTYGSSTSSCRKISFRSRLLHFVV